jgi:hypothetical protein
MMFVFAKVGELRGRGEESRGIIVLNGEKERLSVA